MEVSSLLMALNNTTDECYPWTYSSIVLTWIQGPPNKWKTSVGNRVAIIQEETSSSIWRHMPCESNPGDLISRGIEPSTLPTSTAWWKGPHRSSQELSSWPTTEVKTTTDNLEIKNVHWQRTSPNLQPGDLVLLKEDNTTPFHWPIAVISDIHPWTMASSLWSHLGTAMEFQKSN